MTLRDIVDRRTEPDPWVEGDNIPWNEPAFSARMLREHLSQEHDAASRRFATIDRHVAWIHEVLLAGRRTRVLDLACGPGLYTSRLARLGHTCVGIDYSPASIAHAEAEAEREDLACRYRLEDLRSADYGSGFGLAMLLFGEFNAFRPVDARRILNTAHAALSEGGILLLEPHTFATIRKLGEAGPSWYSSPAGLFSDQPHLVLKESHWHAATRTATTRWYVLDAATAGVTRCAHSLQAYSDEEYVILLSACGFGEVRLLPSLTGETEGDPSGLMAITARARPR